MKGKKRKKNTKTSKPTKQTAMAMDKEKLKQANNPSGVKVDINVVEPRARRQARDGVDVPAQEVHEAGPHGSSDVAHEDLSRSRNQQGSTTTAAGATRKKEQEQGTRRKVVLNQRVSSSFRGEGAKKKQPRVDCRDVAHNDDV